MVSDLNAKRRFVPAAQFDTTPPWDGSGHRARKLSRAPARPIPLASHLERVSALGRNLSFRCLAHAATASSANPFNTSSTRPASPASPMHDIVSRSVARVIAT